MGANDKQPPRAAAAADLPGGLSVPDDVNSEAMSNRELSERERDERIRLRAYELWQADGSPVDRADDYWFRAEAETRAAGPSAQGRQDAG